MRLILQYVSKYEPLSLAPPLKHACVLRKFHHSSLEQGERIERLHEILFKRMKESIGRIENLFMFCDFPCS